MARPEQLVVRSGLWIGPSATGRIGHLDWLRYRHAPALPMTVVADEPRSAVWAEDAARRVWELARTEVTGIRHLVATRAVSRPELGRVPQRALRDRRRARASSAATAARRTSAASSSPTRYGDALAAPLPSVIPDGAARV